MSWNYTNQKKVLEFCFNNGDFGPSTKYNVSKTNIHGQSPFNQIKSFPSKSTWDLWFSEFSDNISMFTDQNDILIYYNIEVVLLLIEDFDILPKSITLVSDNINKTKLAKEIGINVINDGEVIPTMQFTHVIKNPPWDNGSYSSFWPVAQKSLKNNGYQIDILPTNWMTLASFASDRAYLLKHFKIISIKIYDNSKGQVFEAAPGGDVVVIISQKTDNPDNSLVEYTYFDNPIFTVDLTRYEIWPMYISPLSVKIWDLVITKKIHDLNWNKSNPTKYFVSLPTKVHQRINCDFMKNPGTRWELNSYKGITDEQQFFFNSNKQAELHYEWFCTDIFAYILAMAKSQGKNQPHPIAYTGEHSFVNNDFINYFGFTKKHLDEIALWKSKK